MAYLCTFSTTSDLAFSLFFSYCGAQIFEIYGLGQEVVDLAFTGSVSKISGLTFDEVGGIHHIAFFFFYYHNDQINIDSKKMLSTCSWQGRHCLSG